MTAVVDAPATAALDAPAIPAADGVARVPRRRPVVAVVSPKGGSGKTTCAANLAVGIARRIPTTLIDLNVWSGDVEWALGTRPVHRLDHVVRRVLEDPTVEIESMLARRDDLSVLCAPETPIAADGIAPADALLVVTRLAALHRATVLDTGPGVTDYTLGAIDAASHVVLTTGTDVPSVQAARKLLQTMRALRMDDSRAMLVVSRAASGAGLSIAEIESTLGLETALAVPDDRAVAASISTGIPIAEARPDSRPGRGYLELADAVLGWPIPKRRGVLAWMRP
ncbi:MAG: AAA family ATPase [Ilumatobacteraceae bacterium]|jgi:pilus assembly protein CpaE